MNQQIDPKTFIAVIAVVVVIAIGVVFWVWRAPSAPTVTSQAGKVTTGMGRGMMEEMRATHMGRNQGMGGMGAANPNTGK